MSLGTTRLLIVQFRARSERSTTPMIRSNAVLYRASTAKQGYLGLPPRPFQVRSILHHLIPIASAYPHHRAFDMSPSAGCRRYTHLAANVAGLGPCCTSLGELLARPIETYLAGGVTNDDRQRQGNMRPRICLL